MQVNTDGYSISPQTLAALINRKYRATSAVNTEDSSNITSLIRDEIAVSFHTSIDWSWTKASPILVAMYTTPAVLLKLQMK